MRRGERALLADWKLAAGASLLLYANLGETIVPGVDPPVARCLYSTHPEAAGPARTAALAPWCVTWFLRSGHGPT